MERVLTRLFASILLPLLTAAPVSAQAPLSPSTPPIVFSPGTGDGSPAPMVPIRPTLACAALPQTQAILAVPPSPHRLDQKLVNQALAAYAKHNCSYGRTSGPALIVVVDFAKKSSEPRLYRIDLRTGQGIDSPIRVAHGIGSDPNGCRCGSTGLSRPTARCGRVILWCIVTAPLCHGILTPP